MSAVVVKLPTAAASYFAARTAGKWWALDIVIPGDRALGVRDMRTTVRRRSNYATLVAEARKYAARMHSPLRLPKEAPRYTRATANTYRFDVTGEGEAFDTAHVRSLYVRKSAFAGAEPPARIVVTVAVQPEGGAI